MQQATIDNLYKQQFLSDMDYQFARFIGRLDGKSDENLLLAAALVSRYRGEGHICVDLSELSGKVLQFEGAYSLICPSLENWLKTLESSPVVGMPGDYRPLILDGSRLYLFRYWNYEKKLAYTLKFFAENKIEEFDEVRLKEGFDRIFPSFAIGGESHIDWQKVAAFASLKRSLCVISGGPGTGKTYTVAKILALLIEQNRNGNVNIVLTAPTGKAAAKLQESIKEAKTGLNCSESVKKSIPDEASTIHRLLGSIPNSPFFRFNEKNPLPADIVVIDEASMVDLALFSKFTQAIRPRSRLILLGDKDQLASVEAGSVLGDICDTGNVHLFSPSFIEDCRRVTGEEISEGGISADTAGMNDCIVQLVKSYRFSSTSGINALSQAINKGNALQAIELIKNDNYNDIVWGRLPQPDDLPRYLEEWITGRYTDYLKASDPLESYFLFSRFRILCVLRDGPYGVHSLNLMAERILQRKGLINRNGKWYPGRPVMITKNDYNLRLFNGDIGITMADITKDRELRVFFPGTEGSARSYPPLRLPDHETVYAMTVHKSQGSEFDEVLFVTPDRDIQVMTRELIYTAVTRAKEKINIWGKEDILLKAIQRRIQRSSGLREELWGKR
jgi:exodeoxyribonuclease V alpha subunit